MKYKNLNLAYSLEIFIGLITTILIFIISPNALAFLAIISLRPFILDKEKISRHDEYWHISFKLGRDSVFIMSMITIGIFIFLELQLNENVFSLDLDVLLTMLVPIFLIIHGIIGILNMKGIVRY